MTDSIIYFFISIRTPPYDTLVYRLLKFKSKHLLAWWWAPETHCSCTGCAVRGHVIFTTSGYKCTNTLDYYSCCPAYNCTLINEEGTYINEEGRQFITSTVVVGGDRRREQIYKTATASAWVPVIALSTAIDLQGQQRPTIVRGGKKCFVDRTRWAGPSVKHVAIPWAGPVHNSQTLPFNLRVLHTQEVRSELTNSSCLIDA